MRILTIILILSFLGIAVFGFLGMNVESMHALVRCLASLVHGTASCPDFSNVLAAVNFHLDAIKSFVLVTLVFAVLAIVVGAFSVVSVVAAYFLFDRRSLKSFLFNSSFASRRLGRWLALHETSPTL